MAEELVGIINAARAQFLECRDLQFVTKDEVEQWVGAMHTQALLPITGIIPNYASLPAVTNLIYCRDRDCG